MSQTKLTSAIVELSLEHTGLAPHQLQQFSDCHSRWVAMRIHYLATHIQKYMHVHTVSHNSTQKTKSISQQ